MGWEIAVGPAATVLRDLLKVRALRKELDQKTKELDQKNLVLNEMKTQIEQAKNSAESGLIQFAGMYADKAGLMPSITNFLSEVSEEDTSIFLALDFAAFGAISWNEHFCRQAELIRGICQTAATHGSGLRIILNDEKTNREVIERQFPDDEWDAWYTQSVGKLQAWLNCSVFRTLAGQDAHAPGSLSKVSSTGAARLTRRMFIDSYLEFNERLVELYHAEGARVLRRTPFVPLHGWFVRRKGESVDGIIGIADVQAVWNEPGFRVTGRVANKILDFFEEMASGGLPIPRRKLDNGNTQSQSATSP